MNGDPCSALGLHISWTKTKIQNIGAGAPAAGLAVGHHMIKGVESFTYLGSEISLTVGSRVEQHRRIGVAFDTMRRLRRV